MPLHIAILGTGAIAREHAAALARVPGVRVTHVAGSDLTRAAAVAAHAPGAVPSDDPVAILADPTVDAVDICEATPDHARWTIAAGQAGKHVHVEKPAALTVEDFDAMVSATEGAGRSLMVGQTVRFQPAIRALQAALAAGDIGTARLLHVSWYAGYVWPRGWRGWQHDPAQSGGHPVHNGTHALDLAVWLTARRPVRVFVRAFPSFAADMPVPDSFHVTVRFDDGSLALLEISYALRRHGELLRRIMVAGTTGTLFHSTEDDPRLVSDAARPAPSSVEDAMFHQLRHWADTLRGDASPIVTNGQVRTALAAAVAAQRSLESGQPVEVPRTAREVTA
ncbi:MULTISPECIES: Gfo/Idh/MocA family oxidoreductase [unclassified Micromonospora]|uniref:Gfo/Idh/MocA family protein n=1 Tax=unclassified Micromonospora TaxID=2617518 RepID=UPI00332BF74C